MLETGQCVGSAAFCRMYVVYKAPVTPYRIGEMDGSRTKSGEIRQCLFSIRLKFGVFVPFLLMFDKSVKYFLTCSKPVIGRPRLMCIVLLQFESFLSVTHLLSVCYVSVFLI